MAKFPTGTNASIAYCLYPHFSSSNGKRRLSRHWVRHWRSHSCLDHPASCLCPLGHLPVIHLDSSLDPRFRLWGTFFDAQLIAILLKRKRSTWTRSFQVTCANIQYFALLSLVGQTIPTVRRLAHVFLAKQCLYAHCYLSRWERPSRSPMETSLGKAFQPGPPSEILISTGSL